MGGLGLPPITPMVKNIMIACGVIWLLQIRPFFNYGPLMASGPNFELWQPFTYMWLHDPRSLAHVLMNMLALYMFGGQLEQNWGGQRFLRFYLICGIFAGFLISGWSYLRGDPTPTLGASGAVFGVLTAYSISWPHRTIMLLFPPIPIRAIYLIPLLFLLQLSMGGAVSHIGHLGGVIAALFLLRDNLQRIISIGNLQYQWHRYRMKGRLREVRRNEWQRRNSNQDDEPRIH